MFVVDNLLKTRKELIPGALVYTSGFICGEEEKTLFSELRTETLWEQHHVVVFGKRYPCPRLSAWHGAPEAVYRYSGQMLKPRPFTPLLASLLKRVEAETRASYNSVLLNLYRDGNDAMGWHADDEPELGSEPMIASLSFGAARRFRIKSRKKSGLRLAVELEPGSLLLMRGPCQHRFLHAVPRTRKPVGPRINLTFRQILPVAGR